MPSVFAFTGFESAAAVGEGSRNTSGGFEPPFALRARLNLDAEHRNVIAGRGPSCTSPDPVTPVPARGRTEKRPSSGSRFRPADAIQERHDQADGLV